MRSSGTGSSRGSAPPPSTVPASARSATPPSREKLNKQCRSPPGGATLAWSKSSPSGGGDFVKPRPEPPDTERQTAASSASPPSEQCQGIGRASLLWWTKAGLLVLGRDREPFLFYKIWRISPFFGRTNKHSGGRPESKLGAADDALCWGNGGGHLPLTTTFQHSERGHHKNTSEYRSMANKGTEGNQSPSSDENQCPF